MGKIIVVDDIHVSADTRALHARNTVEALVLLESVIPSGETIDELWLDYDMTWNDGVGASTTLPIVEWLITNQQSRTPLVVRNIYVHSRNSKSKDLVDTLSPYFDICQATLPSPLWWEQPEDLPQSSQPTPEEAQ